MLNFVRRNKKQGFISIWAIISLFIGTITAILIFAYISIIFNIVPGLNKYRAYQKIKKLRIAALLYSSNKTGSIYSKNKDIIPALVKYGDLDGGIPEFSIIDLRILLTTIFNIGRCFYGIE
ncbi:MAG: hypothetical protein ACYCS0_08330 [bacterium]|jgi:hypothetical protein